MLRDWISGGGSAADTVEKTNSKNSRIQFSGTGETKVLKFRWVDGGSIEVTEMTKRISLRRQN